MTEMEAEIAVVTETWLRDGRELEDRREIMREEMGLHMIARNRGVLSNGVAYGGVAVVWREGNLSFKEVVVKNPAHYEVVVAASSIKGHCRKLVVIGCYLPPSYNTTRGEAALEFISDTVTEVKKRFKDPYILLAGDFNQWEVGEAVLDHADIGEVDLGPTRGGRSIDRVLLNVGRSVVDYGTLGPLETEEHEGEVRRSDHRVCYVGIGLERREAFTWQKYTYRHYDDQAEKNFKSWVVLHDWREVYEAEGSEDKANAYQATIQAAIGEFFPLRTTHRRSTDLPWMSRGVLDQIDTRKRIFAEAGGAGRRPGRSRRD